MTRRVLVAGIGNIFLSDDGFGVAVAQRLARRAMPEGVRAVDFGIRGIHLAYELLDGYDALVLIDAMPLGEPPGTVAFVEPNDIEVPDGDDPNAVLDAHSMHPGVVLTMMAMLQVPVERIVILGCQPATLEEGIGLSAPVAAAVEATVDLLDDLLTEIYTPVESEVGS
jgi:hydrogenase maturation protease